MYEISIKIPVRRIGVINKIRKVLRDSYETSSPKSGYALHEILCNKSGSFEELGISFEIKESGEN